jgi:DNA-binding CsgD family transcriptional regulator
MAERDAGRAALERGAWEEARRHFEAALAEADAPEAWEGLGWAGWWLADEDLTFDARLRAYRGYRARGDDRAAGRVATWLAADYREYRGEAAVARGWLERAHRLLDPLPECAEHGWLAVNEADVLRNDGGDLAEIIRLCERAVEIGRAHGVPDLEAVGLAQHGIAEVMRGDLEQGMRRLDEAAVTVAAEDLHLPLSFGWVHCCLLSACEGVGDFDRAAQWCQQIRPFVDRWGGRQLLGICRSTYGRVLVTRGDWPSGEAELAGAVADLEAARPGMSGESLARLGELRLRQGRIAEARALFERAGPAGVLGPGRIALAEGDADAAVEAAERVLRHLAGDKALERLDPLELLVRACAELARCDAAAGACAEIERTAERLGTPYVRGRARLAVGEMAAAAGDADGARRAFEDAVDGFEASAAPYEAATARLALSRALAALGRRRRAAEEAAAARRAFAAFGAEADAERAAALAAGDGDGAGAAGELTPRELEVLALVARGLSDAEIAERLVVSPHTVHRHVANVRTKLGLSSRAAAVAYAAREGLL